MWSVALKLLCQRTVVSHRYFRQRNGLNFGFGSIALLRLRPMTGVVRKRTVGHVRHVPITVLSSCSKRRPLTDASLGHLVGTSEQRRRDGEAKRLCGLEIDDKLVLGWGLYRQLGGRCASQNTIYVLGRLPKLLSKIRPIGDEAARTDEVGNG